MKDMTLKKEMSYPVPVPVDFEKYVKYVSLLGGVMAIYHILTNIYVWMFVVPFILGFYVKEYFKSERKTEVDLFEVLAKRADEKNRERKVKEMFEKNRREAIEKATRGPDNDEVIQLLKARKGKSPFEEEDVRMVADGVDVGLPPKVKEFNY